MSDPLNITLELTRDGEDWDPERLPAGDCRYRLRVDGGEPAATGVFPWNAQQIADLSSLAGADAEQRAALGAALRRQLAPAGWGAVAARVQEALRAQRRVVISVVARAAELLYLPWELLELPDRRPLHGLPGVLWRISWSSTQVTPLRRDAEGHVDPKHAEGRVLFAWSEAGGAVPHGEHRAALESACGAGSRRLDVLEHAELQALTEALAQEPPTSVLHLLCHGHPGGLFLGERGVDAGALASALAPFADRLRLVVIHACEGARSQLGGALGSVAERLHRVGIDAVLGSRAPLSAAGSVRLAQGFSEALVAAHQSLEVALLSGRAALGPEDARALQLWQRPHPRETRPLTARPYRGLEAFEAAQGRFFFGRDAEIQEALADLNALPRGAAPRLLFIVGASGTGKSSMARAGVMPKVAARFAQVRALRPGEALPEADAGALVLVDQAEELFTQVPEEARQPWLDALLALATDAAGSAVLLTLRVDYLGHCGQLSLPDGRRLDQLAYDEAHRVFLPMMGRAQLVEVVRGPAEVAGVEVAPGLAEQLVEEVAGEPGALPLLEFALDRMWLERRPGEGLTLEGYRRLGGAVGALLEREADALIDGLSEAQREAARSLLVQLVATGEGQRADTRRSRLRRDLGEGVAYDEVLRRLAAARLVVTGGGGEGSVEIAHEELIRRWGRLREWVDADRQKWIEIERVRGWTHGLRGGQLDRAKEARERWGAALGEGTLAHIAASEQAVEAEAARERARQAALKRARDEAVAQARAAQRRTLVAGALAILGLALSAGLVWVFQRMQDEMARSEELFETALTLARESSNALKLGAARELADSDPATALMFLADMDILETDTERLPGFEALSRALLQRPLRVPAQVIQHGTQAILDVDISLDGERLLTAGRDNRARLWSASSGEPIGEPLLHEGWVFQARFSPDGAMVLTGARDATARLWSAEDGRPLSPALAHGEAVRVVAFSPDSALAATGSVDGLVRLWRTPGGAPVGELDLEGGSVEHLDFSPDGQRLLVGAEGGVVQALSVPDLEPVAPPVQLDTTLYDARFSPDARWVLTATQVAGARVWSASDSTPRTPPLDHPGPVYAAAFSPDGARVVTGSADGGVRLWSAETGLLLGQPAQHGEAITSVRLSADGALLLSTSRDPRAHLGAGEDLEPTGPALEHGAGVSAATLSADGRWALTGDFGGLARLWSLESGAPLGGPLQHGGSVFAVEVSPDGQRLATGSEDGTARLWRAQDGVAVGEAMVHDGPVLTLAFSPDGQRLATGSEDGTARVWSALDGAWLGVTVPHDGPVRAVAFSPDSETLWTGGRGRVVQAWGARDGAPLGGSIPHPDRVFGLAVSPDGSRLASACADGGARQWSTSNGAALGPVLKHEAPVSSVAYASDGQSLLTGSLSGGARLWRAEDGALMTVEQEPLTFSADLALTADDARAVTVGGSALRWWSPRSGAPVAEPLSTSSILLSVAVSEGAASGEARLWTGTLDGLVLPWVAGADGALSQRGDPFVLEYLDGLGLPCLPPSTRMEHLIETEERAQEAYSTCVRFRSP